MVKAEMNWKLKIVLKFIAAFPIAYLMGNVIFGVLSEGSWLPDMLDAVLKPAVYEVLIEILVWVARIGTFFFLLYEWVFEVGKRA